MHKDYKQPSTKQIRVAETLHKDLKLVAITQERTMAQLATELLSEGLFSRLNSEPDTKDELDQK